MNTFQDSSALVDDARALRRRLAQDGYLFLRGIMDRTALGAAAMDVARILAEQGFARLPSDPEEALRAGVTAVLRDLRADSDAFLARYRRLYRLGSLHTIPMQRRLRDLVEALFGEPIVHHPVLLPRVMFPDLGDGAKATPSHQDYPSTQGSERTVTVWCPLGDYDLPHGTLVIARGHHRNGLYPHGVSSRDIFELQEDFAADEVMGPVRAGDVLLFTCFTPHRAAPNLSRIIRLSVDFRFQPVADPVSDLNFSDFCISPREPWEDIYRTGSIPEALHHFWKRCPLTYEPHSNAFFDRQVELAIQEAARGRLAARRYLVSVAAETVDFAARERLWAAIRECAPHETQRA